MWGLDLYSGSEFWILSRSSTMLPGHVGSHVVLLRRGSDLPPLLSILQRCSWQQSDERLKSVNDQISRDTGSLQGSVGSHSMMFMVKLKPLNDTT